MSSRRQIYRCPLHSKSRHGTEEERRRIHKNKKRGYILNNSRKNTLTVTTCFHSELSFSCAFLIESTTRSKFSRSTLSRNRLATEVRTQNRLLLLPIALTLTQTGLLKVVCITEKTSESRHPKQGSINHRSSKTSHQMTSDLRQSANTSHAERSEQTEKIDYTVPLKLHEKQKSEIDRSADGRAT